MSTNSGSLNWTLSSSIPLTCSQWLSSLPLEHYICSRVADTRSQGLVIGESVLISVLLKPFSLVWGERARISLLWVGVEGGILSTQMSLSKNASSELLKKLITINYVSHWCYLAWTVLLNSYPGEKWLDWKPHLPLWWSIWDSYLKLLIVFSVLGILMHLHSYGSLLPFAVLWASHFTSVSTSLINDCLPTP